MHIQAIVQSFSKMKGDIAAERRAYERIWNEREKNLGLVMRNTSQMFGSIKDIAGNAIRPEAKQRCAAVPVMCAAVASINRAEFIGENCFGTDSEVSH